MLPRRFRSTIRRAREPDPHLLTKEHWSAPKQARRNQSRSTVHECCRQLQSRSVLDAVRTSPVQGSMEPSARAAEGRGKRDDRKTGARVSELSHRLVLSQKGNRPLR